ncbi:hypothetical protein ABPG74_010789 [Tetrahymena malaccensis]
MSNKAQNKAIQIYQTIQSQLPKPEIIVFNDPHTTDQYKFGVVKLDENFYYDGVVRGNRPDGIGIMTDKRQLFSVRGRFANTKLCGAGRVELESGEIYDGVFRNGIFCSGICYHSKEDRFIYGNFKTPEIKILLKGKGYPYQLFLNNKEKLYDSTLVYKTTCSEIVFAPQEDRHLVREFDRFKYNLDIPSSRSSYQESIFETSERESHFSLIQDEMSERQQDDLKNKMNKDNIEIFDQETKQMIENTQKSIIQNEENYYQNDDYDDLDINDIKRTADFSHQDVDEQEQYSDPLLQISKNREQRIKQMQEQSNQSYILIESLRNQLDSYEEIKRNNIQQKQNNNFDFQQNQMITNNVKYQQYEDQNDQKISYFQNKNIQLPQDYTDNIEPKYQNPLQLNSLNQLQNSSIKDQQFYNEYAHPTNQSQFNNNFQSSFTNNFNKEYDNSLQQKYQGTQILQESTNSQKSFATFSNKKNGVQLFYQDIDDTEQDKLPSTHPNQCIKIQINQSLNLKEESFQKYENPNNNKNQNAQFKNDLTKIIITDLTKQISSTQNQNQISQKDTNKANLNQDQNKLLLNNYNFSDKNRDENTQDLQKFSQQQIKTDIFKEKLQKQLNDQQVIKKNQNDSVEIQKSQDEESKDYDRIRQRSQFSVDFDPNLTSNNKQLEQEMIENYFENLKAQFTDKNQNNSTGTISALNEILSDQNYQSKGRTEDYSLMQILDEKLAQNRSQSIEKASTVQRKFLDSSIQYLESDHNINFKDSQNNSGFTHSLDRSGRKTIDKSNPSQFYRYTQNSLSEKNNEDYDEDEELSKEEFQIKNSERNDSVIENDQNSIEQRNYSVNDQAFINSNLNLTEIEQ